MNEPKRTEAIALKYDHQKDMAPKVIAKGKGVIAEQILETAKELNIPVQQDPSLAELLGKLDINQVISDELYGAVAEVFAFIYQLDRKLK